MSDLTIATENRSELSPVATIIVTCKGRVHHLRQSIPLMLGQRAPFAFEIVVVDYGCPDGAFEYCRELADKRLNAVRVLDDTEFFNLSRARNCGAMACDSAVLAFVDADALLAPNWLAVVSGPIGAGDVDLMQSTPSPGFWGHYGTCAVAAKTWRCIRGYDEGFLGWGVDDRDFCDRVAAVGRVGNFSPDLVRSIQHKRIDRVRFYEEKEIRVSARRNAAYQKQRTKINPGGFGQMKFESTCRDSKVQPTPPCMDEDVFQNVTEQ